ncbi:MAG TPA: site-specific recombinase [Burkholderiaceae bacterium]
MSLPLFFSDLAKNGSGDDIGPIKRLLAQLRPASAKDGAQATRNVQALCHMLESNPEHAAMLRAYLRRLIGGRRMSHLLSDTGITKNTGFWSAAWHRFNYKWLPPVVRDEYWQDMFGEVFYRRDDHRWVAAVDDSVWTALVRSFGFDDDEDRTIQESFSREMLKAIQSLSYRISTIGLEPELVRNWPTIEDFESPFLRQNAELNQYEQAYAQWLVDPAAARDDSRHIEVLLTQCEEIVVKIRRASASHGISVSLTRLLLRLTESIARLRTLLALLDAAASEEAAPIAVGLFKELVRADNVKHSLTDLVSTNTELLALQVTENASRSGEHYVTRTRIEWWAMLRSAMGAGFIVGFMAMLKILAGKLALAPAGYAVLYSLNYALGFMLVHILHFTIATKQPAMTAALMAQAIDQGKQKLDQLTELVIQVVRTQFIAIVGNVALAMPVALLIALAWAPMTGRPLADADKAHHLLQDLDPVHSLALFHAAIAGVCLFLSGLISGYYDNKAAYADIAGRIAQLRWLKRFLGPARTARVATYIGDNLGALSGNLFFGIMLGCIGTLGSFFGLPLDIRHITFSSANLMFAAVGMNGKMSLEDWALPVIGVVLIGAVNLLVSFTLALTVALRSRGVNLRREWTVLGELGRRALSTPRDFCFPPPDSIDLDGPQPAAPGADAGEHNAGGD